MSTLDLLVDGAYLVSALLFVAGIKKLGKLRDAPRGNRFLSAAMLLAVVTTILDLSDLNLA
ncbi:MAG TPA: hypothetical protein VK524_24260, partial [Polyangiaceae bacterium]|nr:hypothetical protein [Polyangiaceae bacterium]